MMLRQYAASLGVAALLAGLAFMGYQQLRIGDLKLDLANEQKAASDLRADRERVAREHAARIADIQATHALQQQAQENEYEEKLNDLGRRNNAGAAESKRLRKLVQTYAAAASCSRGGGSGPAADQRAADRTSVLAGLLEEGIGLVVEGRGVVERRDAEVKRLLDQIATDRAACQAANKSVSPP